MVPQGPQGAAGRAERRAARVREGPAADGVVLEGAGLAAGAEVRIGRRLHCRHAGVVGVQVRVIHLIHRRSRSSSSSEWHHDTVSSQTKQKADVRTTLDFWKNCGKWKGSFRNTYFRDVSQNVSISSKVSCTLLSARLSSPCFSPLA